MTTGGIAGRVVVDIFGSFSCVFFFLCGVQRLEEKVVEGVL
jgi:hypothetical protein